MEWLGLVMWAMVVGLAMLMAGAGGLTAPALGLASLLATAGLVFCVLYIVLGGGRWMAWVSAGCALAATPILVSGASVLLDDERGSADGTWLEEQAAGIAGVEIPLLLTLTFVMALAAGGVTTVS
ncbi:MAG TPA: hypothetical protein VFG42_23865 [Baekduia sp.]|uniref:hypothetical protein n=1 Tax=Baekduia sp. TaxID=2600305 RepID=UPI002D764E8D|nr:hypothetical protein [Baekduia sp.]HET6509852.1 hypothetical protein [Baekduia sp.]